MFNYILPKQKIAQRPVYPYHLAKLLVVDRQTSTLRDSTFIDISSYFRPGDLIVFNNSKVIPARLFGTLDSGGRIELLLIESQGSSTTWRALGKPMKKFSKGRIVNFANGLKAEILERSSEMEILVRFFSDDQGDLSDLLLQAGVMPIPPYIRNGAADEFDISDYQTPFGVVAGSVAAPTASLHFTEDVCQKIRSEGVEFAEVTLHLGPASFLPLYDSEVDPDGKNIKPPQEERLLNSEKVSKKIIETKRAGGRVIAVGTSVVRALESAARNKGIDDGRTDLFITPGFEFKYCDIVVTNFHQPGTTHLLLVEALMGSSLISKAYTHALKKDYRFLSYGDGMVII